MRWPQLKSHNGKHYAADVVRRTHRVHLTVKGVTVCIKVTVSRPPDSVALATLISLRPSWKLERIDVSKIRYLSFAH